MHSLCFCYFFLAPLSFSSSLRPSVCHSVSLHSEVHDTATSKLFTSDHSLRLPCCSAPFVQNCRPSAPPSFVSLLACVHTRACTLSCTCSLAYVILHPFGFLPPPLMEASCSCLIFGVFKSEKSTHAPHTGNKPGTPATHARTHTDPVHVASI